MPRLELVETSLRAGQQGLLVSRLRQRHAVPVAQQLERCGFAALEVFGGTTFEAQVRFLGEQPFDRLRAIREAAPTTPLLATVGGQALVGHRHVADDLVDAFVRVAADAGVDIFRFIDPLNDPRNLSRSLRAAHAAARRAEGVIVVGDASDDSLAAATRLAAALGELGYDSLCLHDPLGTLGIDAARRFVKAITAAAPLPLTVSFSAQTGQADFAYIAAVEAGAVRADVALSPLAGGASFPAAEAVVAALRSTKHDPGLDLERVAAAALILESALVHYNDVVDTLALRLDTSALRGLIPPSALGAALIELRNRDALERITEVEHEVVRVRQELGSPPLVTPLTEIIAMQAVYNVCDGDRYATVSQEIKDYCLGFYGAPPSAIAPDVLHIVNGREQPITLRPADVLDPAIDAVRLELQRNELSPDSANTVGYALFPDEWIAVVRGGAQIERLGDEVDTDIPAVAADSSDVAPAPAEPEAAPEEVRDLTVDVDGQTYTVRVRGAPGTFGGGGGGSVSVEPGTPVGKPVAREGTVVAPMQGLILKVPVTVGQKVELGDVVAVLEAMKMQNDITAPRAGTVSEVFVKEGSVVAPRDAVVHIA